MKQEKKELEISREMYLAVRFISGVLALALMIFTGYGAITFCLGLFAEGEHIVRLPGQESPLVTLSDLPQAPTPIHVDPDQVVEIARADISVAGDVMPHLPIVRSGRTGNGYNFDDVFTYLESYISGADYAVANLETTFSGTDGKDYTGYPNFNSPDAIAASVKHTGFDMLLTGNNHIYDYGTAGLKRTLSVIESFGLESLGAVADKENSRHVIHTLGGVKVNATKLPDTVNRNIYGNWLSVADDTVFTFQLLDKNGNVIPETDANEVLGVNNREIEIWMPATGSKTSTMAVLEDDTLRRLYNSFVDVNHANMVCAGCLEYPTYEGAYDYVNNRDKAILTGGTNSLVYMEFNDIDTINKLNDRMVNQPLKDFITDLTVAGVTEEAAPRWPLWLILSVAGAAVAVTAVVLVRRRARRAHS